MATTPAPSYTTYTHFLVHLPAPSVAHVQINRPHKLNAFTRPMWLELRALFAQLSHDPDVRAVVLTGAGDRAFSAGLDVTEAAKSEPALQGSGEAGGQGGGKEKKKGVDVARKAAVLRRDIYEFQECISAVERCEKRRFFSLFLWSSCFVGG